MAKVQCTCLSCGKPFEKYPSDIKIGWGKYCSVQCRINSTKKPHITYTCQQCHEEFSKIPSAVKRSPARFCSRECFHLSQISRRPFEKECEVCGKFFTIKPSVVDRGLGKYCSPECYKTVMGLSRRGANNCHWLGGHKSYRGANWNQQRQIARERDGNTCQICHRKQRKGERNFPVHHVTPFREFNNYLEANVLCNLITLCHSCHPRAEKGMLPVPRRLF